MCDDDRKNKLHSLADCSGVHSKTLRCALRFSIAATMLLFQISTLQSVFLPNCPSRRKVISGYQVQTNDLWGMCVVNFLTRLYISMTDYLNSRYQ